MIEPLNEKIPMSRQCELLEVNRSSFYYQPTPISETQILLMDKIDEIYTEFPYYGSPRITAQLKRDGLKINHKAVERLMRVMGIQAIFPKKNTSKSSPESFKYPYLLNEIDINRPNIVWGTDITYIKACGMWFYLVAILDWFSRYVVSWKLSPTLSVDPCMACLDEALLVNIPDIHNSDQGVQFTSEAYTGILKDKNIQISMDGRGRCFDNIFTERLWRTVKYEEVYLKDYRSFQEAEQSLAEYFKTYNNRRLHQSLDYQTPAEVYFKN